MTPQEPEALSNVVKYAIWKCNGMRCFLCRHYIVFRDSTVDHVIPKSLRNDLVAFRRHLHLLGLPYDFDVDAYYNLLPCCHLCNNRKWNRLFPPGLTLLCLWQAKKNEACVREFSYETAKSSLADCSHCYFARCIRARNNVGISSSLLTPIHSFLGKMGRKDKPSFESRIIAPLQRDITSVTRTTISYPDSKYVSSPVRGATNRRKE
jgi:5-methylcytosine-specific restriction endonuclease McrA